MAICPGTVGALPCAPTMNARPALVTFALPDPAVFHLETGTNSMKINLEWLQLPQNDYN
jgi:hypothetical protein